MRDAEPHTPEFVALRRDGTPLPGCRVIDLGVARDADQIAARMDDRVTVCWSGAPGEGAFARDWSAWGPAGWDALAAGCVRLGPVLAERGARLLLRPHARHVLSDPFRCRRFLDDRPGGAIGVALDAGAMLEATMLSDAEGYTERAFEMLGPVAGAIVLTGVRAGAGPDDPLVACPVDAGPVDPGFIGEMIHRHAPADAPLLLPGPHAEAARQLAAMGLAH